MDFAISPHPRISLPIVGQTSRFPVHRIFCIGKNYAEHIVEMGGDLSVSQPVVFMKDASSLIQSGQSIPYPRNTDSLHHEVELVVAMGPKGIFGYAVGLDMTRRDLQAQAKQKGGPWDRAKNFPNSAPCGPITLATQCDIASAEISLKINASYVQRSQLNKMIWSVDTIIEFLKDDLALTTGDLIFTGTPEGVGSINMGDKLEAKIDGLEMLTVEYGA